MDKTNKTVKEVKTMDKTNKTVKSTNKTVKSTNKTVKSTNKTNKEVKTMDKTNNKSLKQINEIIIPVKPTNEIKTVILDYYKFLKLDINFNTENIDINRIKSYENEIKELKTELKELKELKEVKELEFNYLKFKNLKNQLNDINEKDKYTILNDELEELNNKIFNRNSSIQYRKEMIFSLNPNVENKDLNKLINLIKPELKGLKVKLLMDNRYITLNYKRALKHLKITMKIKENDFITQLIKEVLNNEN